MEEFPALKNKNITLILTLVFVLLSLHGVYIFSKDQKPLEGESIFHGDYTYYVDGAISISQLNPVEKFNNKHQPIMASRPVAADSIPIWKSWLAIAYPFPSFKFGYSLTAGILTGLISNEYFEQIISRLAFTNLIFNCGILCLVIQITSIYSKNYLYSLFPSIFFILDTYNLHNSYIYQSHTNSGIFFFLLAVFLFLKKHSISKERLFLIANFLTFSILSSSHIFITSNIFCALMLIWTLKNCVHGYYQYFIYCLYFVTGASLWPLYIYLVEYVLNFNEIGLPSYFAQYLNYTNTVTLLINTYPLAMRQIWALKIWNFGIYLVFIYLAILLLLKQINDKKLSVKNFFNINLNYNKINIIFITFIITIIITSIYSQPIIRAMVPNLVLFDVFLGMLFAYAISKSPKLIRYSSVIVLFTIYIINFTMYGLLYSRNERFITLPSLNPSSNVFHVTEKHKISLITEKYFKDGAYANWVIPSGKLGLHSMSISDFVLYLENHQNIGESIYKDLWIQIDPIEIVEQYSNTRRLIPEFTPLKENIVNEDTVLKDFYLLESIMKNISLKKINENDYKISPVSIWDLKIFDMEYNYIYGYNNKFSELIPNLYLSKIDYKSIYFIKFSSLMNIVNHQ